MTTIYALLICLTADGATRCSVQGPENGAPYFTRLEDCQKLEETYRRVIKLQSRIECVSKDVPAWRPAE